VEPIAQATRKHWERRRAGRESGTRHESERGSITGEFLNKLPNHRTSHTPPPRTGALRRDRSGPGPVLRRVQRSWAGSTSTSTLTEVATATVRYSGQVSR